MGIIDLDLGPDEANVFRNSRVDLEQAGVTQKGRRKKHQSSKELESWKGSVR